MAKAETDYNFEIEWKESPEIDYELLYREEDQYENTHSFSPPNGIEPEDYYSFRNMAPTPYQKPIKKTEYELNSIIKNQNIFGENNIEPAIFFIGLQPHTQDRLHSKDQARPTAGEEEPLQAGGRRGVLSQRVAPGRNHLRAP